MVCDTFYFKNEAVGGVGDPLGLGSVEDLDLVNSAVVSAHTVAIYDGTVTETQYFGVRVFEWDDATSTLNELTAGVPVAVGSRATSGSIIASWDHVCIPVSAGFHVVVGVYWHDDYTGWTLVGQFMDFERVITDSLDDCVLDVYYQVRRAVSGGLTRYYFDHGSAGAPSCFGYLDTCCYGSGCGGPVAGQQLFTLINQEDY